VTDFLSRLVERATGEPVGLQRRRPALFEPPVLASGLARAEPEHSLSEPHLVEAQEERVVSAPAEPAAERPAAPLAIPSMSLRPTPGPPHSVGTPERGEDRPLGLPSSAHDPPAEAAPAEGLRLRPRRTVQPEPIIQLPVASRGPQKQAVPADPLSSVEPHRSSPRPAEPAQRSEPPLTPARPALVPPPSQLQPTVGDTGPRAARSEIDRPDQSPAKPATPPPFAPLPRHEIPRVRPAAAVTQQRQPGPPTIHVTIGRVEVRAVPPPPVATRPQRPTGPRLSLDDYLKLRAGGGK
jgi:hypothetical protein